MNKNNNKVNKVNNETDFSAMELCGVTAIGDKVKRDFSKLPKIAKFYIESVGATGSGKSDDDSKKWHLCGVRIMVKFRNADNDKLFDDSAKGGKVSEWHDFATVCAKFGMDCFGKFKRSWNNGNGLNSEVVSIRKVYRGEGAIAEARKGAFFLIRVCGFGPSHAGKVSAYSPKKVKAGK